MAYINVIVQFLPFSTQHGTINVIDSRPFCVIQKFGLPHKTKFSYPLPYDVAELHGRITYAVNSVHSTMLSRVWHELDYSLIFVEWAQNEIAVVPDFHKRILFSDEAHFWLNGYVNKQNCRIWSEANPQVYVETPLHPEKLTVWCALWAGGILLQKR
ncbi:hypothetical protein TNCV_2417041 [Trichonephila clavipes]|nr:hypothetical protein TNCV_2417041 [Trichonephila clavipes]